MYYSHVFYSNAKTSWRASYTPDIVYANRPGKDLKLQLLSPVPPALPMPPRKTYMTVLQEQGRVPRPAAPAQPAPDKAPRFPLIVSVPGSGWAGAEGTRHVPAMVQLAEAGFVVASISYRGVYQDDAPFPAVVQDVKEAIRFLKANADIYHIDTDRIALLGDSSGGQTVVFASLCGDGPEYSIGANLDQTADVNACVAFYAPVDPEYLVQDRIAEHKDLRFGEDPYPFELHELFQETYGDEPEKYLQSAGCSRLIPTAKNLPPFLFIQGDDDIWIPMAQDERFCDNIRAAGGRAEMIKIAGGGHGLGCWTPEVYEQIIRFLKAYL